MFFAECACVMFISNYLFYCLPKNFIEYLTEKIMKNAIMIFYIPIIYVLIGQFHHIQFSANINFDDNCTSKYNNKTLV